MDDFENMIISSMRDNDKTQIQLQEHNRLLMYLHGLTLITGRFDIMYCNAFLDEAIQLLTNSVFLYEDGLFDCAFYSLRQAGEVVDSMLYLSKNDKDLLKQWSAKKRYPMDSKLKVQLNKISDDYEEIRSAIPEYFEHHAELINKSNKIIHKQGYDTFYHLRNRMPDRCGFSQDKETQLFVESLKYTIGIVLIIFIILEPMSLALSDEEVALKINFNPLTEPIDIYYFSEFLQLDDIVDKIKSSKFYQDYISNFTNNEAMSPAVCSVVKDEAWDINALDEIEKQLNLLGSYEQFMFYILKSGIKISNFYYNGGLTWYFTSIMSNYKRRNYGGEEFQNYLKSVERFNQPCSNVYMSVITMYDEPLYIEHNNILSNDEIQTLEKIEAQGILDFQKLNDQFTLLTNE